MRGKTLALVKEGIFDEKNGIYSYEFKHGTTGLLSLGGGYFYLSEPKSEAGVHSSVICLYRYTGEEKPFRKVEEV